MADIHHFTPSLRAFAKQSIEQQERKRVDCFVASAFARRRASADKSAPAIIRDLTGRLRSWHILLRQGGALLATIFLVIQFCITGNFKSAMAKDVFPTEHGSVAFLENVEVIDIPPKENFARTSGRVVDECFIRFGGEENVSPLQFGSAAFDADRFAILFPQYEYGHDRHNGHDPGPIPKMPRVGIYLLFGVCILVAFYCVKAALYGNYNFAFTALLYAVGIGLVYQGLCFLTSASTDLRQLGGGLLPTTNSFLWSGQVPLAIECNGSPAFSNADCRIDDRRCGAGRLKK
jgi:hypothetical protein